MQSLEAPRRLLACLGEPSRFRVVTHLFAGECCVTDLAARIGLSQSCTTRHLQALEREGMVQGLRAGKRVVYRLRLEEPSVRALVLWALESGPAGAEHWSEVGAGAGRQIANREVTATAGRDRGRPEVEESGTGSGGEPDGGDLEDFLL